MRCMIYASNAIYAIRLKHPSISYYSASDESTELFLQHSFYVKIMIQYELTSDDRSRCIDAMLSVRKKGCDLYGTVDPEVGQGKLWISLNSHLLTHTMQYALLYGAPRNCWVFSYESMLGRLKRSVQQHRNGMYAGKYLTTFHLHN